MRISKNSLQLADVTTVPIKVKYSSSYTNNTIGNSGIQRYVGVNVPIAIEDEYPEEVMIYKSIKHLFYSNYTSGSFPISSSLYENWLQSTAASGTLEADNRYFPTGTYDTIQVLSVPREVYGEKTSRGAFKLFSNNYYIIDDGNGNLIDTGSSSHVGNAFYAQGLFVITNQDYQNILFPPCGAPVSFPGFQSYPSTQVYDFGTSTGSIEIRATGYILPDRFIVTWDNKIQIDTGYIGSASYDFGGSQRGSITNSLFGKIDPLTGQTYPFTHFSNRADGYPIVYPTTGSGANPSYMTASFTKDLIFPFKVTVNTYAPGANTGWKYTIYCPTS